MTGDPVEASDDAVGTDDATETGGDSVAASDGSVEEPGDDTIDATDDPSDATDHSTDAAADPIEALRTDPALAPLVETHGHLALEPAEEPFERLVVSVVNQQLSTASAAAIRDRLFEQVAVTPEGLLAAEEAVLREVGLSGQKIRYLRSIAEHFRDGLSPSTYAGLSDEAVVEDLTEITGVGVWTAKMFLMFVLAREDVFPVEDLGIRRGMERLFEEDMTRVEMRDRAEAWRPHRSYASLYLWRAVD